MRLSVGPASQSSLWSRLSQLAIYANYLNNIYNQPGARIAEPALAPLVKRVLKPTNLGFQCLYKTR